jgi:hypothetical protein
VPAGKTLLLININGGSLGNVTGNVSSILFTSAGVIKTTFLNTQNVMNASAVLYSHSFYIPLEMDSGDYIVISSGAAGLYCICNLYGILVDNNQMEY